MEFGVLSEFSVGFGLDLADSLSGEAEAFSDLFEGVLHAVRDAEAHGEDGGLARVQAAERLMGQTGEGLVQDLFLGRGGVLVGEEAGEVGVVVLIGDALVERGRGHGDAAQEADAVFRLVQREGELGVGGLSLELLAQATLGAVQLVDQFAGVDRDADQVGAVGQGAGDRLADPPGRVGGELVAPAVVEFLDGAEEADVALLDEVEQVQALLLVLLRDRDDEAQVGDVHRALGVVAVPLDLGQATLGAAHQAGVGREQFLGVGGQFVDVRVRVQGEDRAPVEARRHDRGDDRERDHEVGDVLLLEAAVGAEARDEVGVELAVDGLAEALVREQLVVGERVQVEAVGGHVGDGLQLGELVEQLGPDLHRPRRVAESLAESLFEGVDPAGSLDGCAQFLLLLGGEQRPAADLVEVGAGGVDVGVGVGRSPPARLALERGVGLVAGVAGEVPGSGFLTEPHGRARGVAHPSAPGGGGVLGRGSGAGDVEVDQRDRLVLRGLRSRVALVATHLAALLHLFLDQRVKFGAVVVESLLERHPIPLSVSAVDPARRSVRQRSNALNDSTEIGAGLFPLGGEVQSAVRTE